MPLSPGARLGPYEVVSKLGEGRNGIAVAHAFDLAKLELVGDPRPIGPAGVGSWGRGARLSVSETGVLLITTADAYDYQLAWFDRNGKPAGTLGAVHQVSAVQAPRVSPDGSRVAIQINDQQAQNQDLWLGSVANGSFERFTTQKQFEQMPVWSSDGANVFMATSVNAVAGIYRIPVGGGAFETIAEGVIFPQDASRDGRWLFYQHRGDSTRLDIWALPLTNGVPSKDAKPRPIVNSEFEETSPQISPDGQWLAYQSDVTGTSEIYLRRFVDGRTGPSTKVAAGHGTTPRWSKDGRTLFYVSAPQGNLSAQMMSVVVTPSGDTMTFSAPTLVFKARMLPLGTVSRDFDIGPDGRFVVGTVVGPTKGTAATVVLNWMEVVK